MSFIQPAFWSLSRGRALPRWAAVPVTPAVTIVSSSIASPTVITTLVPHGLATGDTATIAGHTGATPAVAGALAVTVLTPTTLTVPVAVTVAGSGGTVTRTTVAPIIALADAKLHTRIGADVTAEDVPVANWTRAATAQVENDTGRALGIQTFDLAGDAFPAGAGPILLPFGPLASVVHVKTVDTAGVEQTMAAAGYLADVSSIPGRIGLADTATWPTDLRQFQPATIRAVFGSAVASIPEPLLQAVRLAVAWHSANREPTSLELRSYDWLLDPYRQVAVA